MATAVGVAYLRRMVTLHIEHPITDFTTWHAAFERFADARRQSGVRSHHLQRPIDDPNYLMIDLEFETAEQAQRFLTFLQTNVWTNPGNSPALAGTPSTRILEPAG